MREPTSDRVTISHRSGNCPARRVATLCLLLAVVMLALLPGSVAADGTPGQPVTHTLGVAVTFPDAGLAEGEQLCLALYAGDTGDLAGTAPLQSQCLGPGGSSLLFEGLAHGAYRVVVPAPDSVLNPHRYQGQIVGTSIPDEPNLSAFGIDIALALTPETAGITGSVQVNVYGCPPGTNGGGDATVWASECEYLAGGVPLVLSGIGSVDDTTLAGVTGQTGEQSGQVEFSNLPAGAYRLDGELPENVAAEAAYFVESSLDGGTTVLDPDDTLAIRPAEIKTIDVYLVLTPEDGTAASPAATTTPEEGGVADPGIGDATDGSGASVNLSGPPVTGAIPPEAIPAPTEPADEKRPWVSRLPATGEGRAEASAAMPLLVLGLVGLGWLLARRVRRPGER